MIIMGLAPKGLSDQHEISQNKISLFGSSKRTFGVKMEKASQLVKSGQYMLQCTTMCG